MAPHPRGWREGALVLLLFVVLTVVMTWPQAVRPYDVPDLGDPLFSTWRLAWVAHQVPRDPVHLFDANIFHPERRTLAYSDAMIVPALMTAPLSWAGVHPLVVYNVAVLTAFALSGTAMFLLVRRLTGSRGAALVAGVVFAFNTYRYDHYCHLELLVTLWMPLTLLALHRVIERPRVWAGVAAGVALALQAGSSMYYGVFFACFLLPVGAVLWIGRPGGWQSVRPMAAGAVVAAMLVAVLATPYVQNRRLLGGRPPGEVSRYSATLKSYLVTSTRTVVHRGWLGDGSPATDEARLFPGVVAIVLGLVALWPPVSRTRLAYALGLLVAIELSRGLNGLVYPHLFEWIVPFQGLRVPARFGAVAGLAVAVLAGHGAARLLARLGARPSLRAVAAGVMVLAALLENRPALDLVPAWRHPPSVHTWFQGRPPAVVMEVPSARHAGDRIAEMKYVYFSSFHWQRLLNGNSGFYPPSHVELTAMMRSFPDHRSIGYLRRRGVHYLIVHGAFYAPESFRETADWLDAEPSIRCIGRFAWEGSDSLLYELSAPAHP